MQTESIAEQILRGSQKAGKTYAFDEGHDKSLPAQMWFQESQEGIILFVVFYTQACRWSRCLGCCLPSRMSKDHVAYKALMSQVDRVMSHPEVRRQRETITKVIVSNNGSVLDQATFSSTALMYLLAQLNLNLPNLTVLTLETRPEYVEFAELEFMARALAEGDTATQLEIAVGFEAFDDRIRNEVYDKGLTFEVFERFAAKAAPYGYHIKCYFMLKPVPAMTDDEAVSDIHRAIDYLGDLSGRTGVRINMHLSPTYVGAGTLLEASLRRGEYTPPRLIDVARAALRGKGRALSIFVGLSDEGLAVEGGSFLRPGEEEVLALLDAFNRTQDYDLLDRIVQGWKEMGEDLRCAMRRSRASAPQSRLATEDTEGDEGEGEERDQRTDF